MTPNLELPTMRTRATFGPRVGRPVVHGGVVAMPTSLAMTAANLAALEAAWQFETTTSVESRR